jgi:EAL domain-containing protein (putative c-di-GMP-specific phosphodiesterase class I)
MSSGFSIDDSERNGRRWSGFITSLLSRLKVDSNFIAGVADDGFKQAVCNKILGLANSYGARVVAEGVETRADFFAVREMGFELVQGFLIAKPMPAEKLPYQMHGRPLALPQ